MSSTTFTKLGHELENGVRGKVQMDEVGEEYRVNSSCNFASIPVAYKSPLVSKATCDVSPSRARRA